MRSGRSELPGKSPKLKEQELNIGTTKAGLAKICFCGGSVPWFVACGFGSVFTASIFFRCRGRQPLSWAACTSAGGQEGLRVSEADTPAFQMLPASLPACKPGLQGGWSRWLPARRRNKSSGRVGEREKHKMGPLSWALFVLIFHPSSFQA